jgi:hypothetical protein
MHLRKSPLFAYFPLVAAMLFSTAVAQTNQGSIAGNVTDPSGALVPNARIAAKNANTGATYQTVSSSSGGYRLPNVNIGSYDVTVTAPGFKSAVMAGVLVQTATTTALDVRLQTGATTENVTVIADVPTVQTESADIGTVVNTKQILDLPLALGSTVQAMRSPEAFVFLTPGAVGPGSDSGNGGTFESKISGGQNYATEVLLDGAATTRSENGSSFDETAPSVEALSEFKVLTSTLPSEFGRTTGGIESFNTKAGTNNYHGNIYELFRNEDLDANVWGYNYMLGTGGLDAAQRRSFQRPLDRQNDYGGTLGGPVVIPHLYNGRDKTFFFFSWEQYRQTQGGTSTDTLPTTAERGGDFSATLNTGNILGVNPCDGTPIYEGEIFDPATTQTVGGIQCRTAFLNEPGSAGNVVPANRISNVAKNILSFYPTPQNNNLLNNYVFAFSFPILDTTTTFRIDQNITAADKAYFTYSSRENVRTSTQPEWANPAGAGRSQFFGTHFIRLGYDHTFGPTVLNHLNIGYNRTNSKNVGAGVSQGNGKDWDQALGINGGASGPMFPIINPGEPNVNGMGDDVDGDTIDNGFRFSDTLNWIKGKHEFKFGYEQWYTQYSPLNFGRMSGDFNFGRAETAGTQSTTNLSGNGVASLLLGAIDNANYNVYQDQARWVRDYFAGFVQDSFKVTSTLTLNLGLRYEIDQPFKEAQDNYANVSLTAPNPSFGNRPGAWVFAGKGAGRIGSSGERWAETYKKDFGPRFGFAWSPAFLGTGKTAIRGGYGIIYGGLQYADFGAFGRTGFQAQPGFASPDGFNPAFSLDTGLPSANVTLPNLNPSQVNFNGSCCTATYIAKSYGRPPMIQNWSLEVQREVIPDLIADVAYVGQHSTHLRTNYDGTNSLSPQYFSLGTGLFAPVANPFFNPADPFSGPPTFITAQRLVPFPQFFGLNSDGQLENLGQSSYNALEAQLTRRFHNGLNLLASYTWSKTLTNADAALPFFATLHQGGAGQFPYSPRKDVSLSNQDLPQNFVLAYIYELPVGKGKRFLDRGGVTDRVLGGWSFSGIQRYESGQPIALACATGVPAYSGCIRFDRVPGQPLYNAAWASGKHDVVDPTTGAVGPVFNGAAFSDPNSSTRLALPGSAFQFGTFDKVSGAMRMTPYLSEDFNLLKRTKFTESKDLLLQVSFLNAFNRHIWNRPGDLNPNDGGAFSLIPITAFSTTGGGSYLIQPRKIQLQLKFEY